MKKRSDKFIALLLCAFMAFSLIAAAADVPVEPCAECGASKGWRIYYRCEGLAKRSWPS